MESAKAPGKIAIFDYVVRLDCLDRLEQAVPVVRDVVGAVELLAHGRPGRQRRKAADCGRSLIAIAAAVGLLFSFTAGTGRADPPVDASANPFPKLEEFTAWYTEYQPQDFALPGSPGIWFLTPSGLNCGMWFWGSFGCSGNIPGGPPGGDHIAWFNGNRAVHHGWTAAMQFPPGQAQRPLPPRSYITDNSTTCAVTPEGDTYCGHGEFKLFITAAGTWFKAWDDRQSYVCNAYGSCPVS